MTLPKLKSFLACLIAMVVGWPATGTAQDPASVAFYNVTIRTHTDDGLIARGHVIVEGDTITAVSEGPLDPTFRGKRIDGQGGIVMPGLMDMHVHYYEDGIGSAYLANSITTVRNLTGSASSLVRDRLAREGLLLGPRVETSGPIMNAGKPFPNDFFLRIYTPEQARGAVRAQRSAGFRAVKLYDALDEPTYAAAVKEAKAKGMKVYTHVPDAMTLHDVLDLGVDTVEHMDGFAEVLLRDGAEFSGDPSRAELWATTDKTKYRALAREVAKSDVWIVPTFAITVGRMTSADPDAYFARPEAAILPTWARTWRRSAETFAPIQEFYPIQMKAKQEMVAELEDAGAGLLIGTDGPNPFVTPGYAIHDELKAFVEAGLSPDRVLRMATVDAARFLGREGKLGIVATGARADLVLVSSDPAEDLSVLRRPLGTMVSGHWHSAVQIEDALRRRRLSRGE